MNIFKRLFAAPDTLTKGVDAVIRAGDALMFTDEEKAAHNARMSEWYLKYLETTNPQNQSRRLIAVALIGVYAFLIVLCAVAGAFGAGEGSYAHFLFSLATNPSVYGPVSLIIAFYFVTHAIRATGKKNSSDD